jgi:hypothetical protein
MGYEKEDIRIRTAPMTFFLSLAAVTSKRDNKTNKRKQKQFKNCTHSS